MVKINFSKKECEELLDLFCENYQDDYLSTHDSLKALPEDIPLRKAVMEKLSENHPAQFRTTLDGYIKTKRIHLSDEDGLISTHGLKPAHISMIHRIYRDKQKEYENFLSECRATGESNNAKLLFSTLCYNFLVVMGVNADKVKTTIQELEKNNILFEGSAQHIQAVMKASGYHYHGKKSIIIHENRKRFFDKDCEIPISVLVKGLSVHDPIEARNMLANKIEGLGMKTASHFMRNIGLSRNRLAIIDSHILNKMEEYGVITDLTRNNKGEIKALSQLKYLDYESKIREWSEKEVKIPLDVLDYILWEMDRGDF